MAKKYQIKKEVILLNLQIELFDDFLYY